MTSVRKNIQLSRDICIRKLGGSLGVGQDDVDSLTELFFVQRILAVGALVEGVLDGLLAGLLIELGGEQIEFVLVELAVMIVYESGMEVNPVFSETCTKFFSYTICNLLFVLFNNCSLLLSQFVLYCF